MPCAPAFEAPSTSKPRPRMVKPRRQSPTRALTCLALLVVMLGLGGCRPAKWIGIRLLFDQTPIDSQQVLRDLPYVEDHPHPTKHRFDFYLPRGKDWPTLIFVHGGGWTEGDKNLRAGGVEIYSNIGAFYASHGVGVAVISYRLQPEFTWRQQVEDVARAVVAARRTVQEHGGDPDGLFLSGHSAGAQLAAYAAVADWPQTGVGEASVVGEDHSLCGVVAVSGAGYDLTDQETYDLGADLEVYRRRFEDRHKGSQDQATEPRDDTAWQEEASVVSYLDPDDPPFLVYYAGNEYPSLQHQAKLLHQRLEAAGVASQLAVVPGQKHRRIVLTLSQGKHEMTSTVLGFIEERHRQCQSIGEAVRGDG